MTVGVATNSLIPIGEWITTTLEADATLMALAPGGVWEDHLPESVPPDPVRFPGIVFSKAVAKAVAGQGVAAFMVEAVYTIKAIGLGRNYDAADAAFNQVLAVLDQASGAVSTGNVWACQQQTDVDAIRYSEPVDGGVEFKHSGWPFRIYAH